MAIGRIRRDPAVAEAASSTAEAEVDTTTAFVSGTRMQPQLNPEISLTGSVFHLAGDDVKNQFSIGEWELAVASYLDPYARVAAVFGWSEDEGFGLEEGYVDRLQLPGRTSLVVVLGLMLAAAWLFDTWSARSAGGRPVANAQPAAPEGSVPQGPDPASAGPRRIDGM